MITNDKPDVKMYETKLSYYKDNKLDVEYKKIDYEKNTTKDKSRDTNVNLYNNIRIQVSSIDSQQRNIQDKISLIQFEQIKINQIESSLRKAKEVYMEAIKNENKNESEYKNIIKHFVKQVNNIQQELQDGKDKSHKENKNKQNTLNYIYLDNDITEYQNIDIINNTLREIYNIKTKLSESKANLISLEQMIEGVKAKIKNKESYTEDYLDIIKYTKDVILTNPSKYMNFQNNIISDIVVDIFT
jgi:DNA repair exonuclease SbcCD ATPase subunit